MKLKVKFDFHNVGQGLFYTGKINDFNFVYDCGSKTKEFLNNEIKNYKLENLKDNNIDILVLSHFDDDHINGLDYLLQDVDVEYAIIPYCSPREKLLLASTNSNSPLVYFEFLVDPVTFLLDRGVKNIVLVTDGYSQDYYPNDFENYYRYRNEDKLTIVIGTKNINESLKKAYRKEGKDFFNYWYFKYFYHKVENHKNKIEECLGDKDIYFQNGADLKKYVKDSDTRNKIKECYRKAIDGNKLNYTSLAMYHGPIGFYAKNDYEMTYSNLTLSGFHLVSQKDDGEKIGHLLTGDINFNQNYSEFIDYFIDELEKTAVVQIPHHGSFKSWNSAILYDFNECDFWVTSSGFSNQYSHPHRDVISDIFDKKRLFGWCHEFSKVTFGGELIRQ